MSPKRVAVMCGDPLKAEPYEEALRNAGGEPVRNPDSLDGIEGVLLTGGTDVNPLRYGENPAPEALAPDDERDERELHVLHEALRADIPVLAICRGLQLFNVHHGGSLVQHLPGEVHRSREADAHPIAIDAESRLADVIGSPEYMVNSRHHQAAGRIGAGLRVAARCPADDVVEALEDPSKLFAVAVQWHPEDRVRTHEPDRRLFEAFIRAIAECRR